jgi:prevent-host-death family protein
MKLVRISELKSHLSKHLRGVEAGQVLEITDRARPIARVIPIARAVTELDIIPAQRSFASVRKRRFTSAKLPVGSLDVLRLERGSR